MTTPWQAHVEKWSDCRRCRLCAGRKRVVLARGSLPCDVLFVGEAPGESEDVVGLPFKGPAGRLLDQIVKEALNAAGCEMDSGGQNPDGSFINVWMPADVRVAFTNLVACIPREPDSRHKAVEPLPDEIQACAPRLQEIVRLADPKLIVRVGKLATDWLDPADKKSVKLHKEVAMIDIVHPAAILRMPVAGQGLAVRRAVVMVSDALEVLQ